MDTEQLQAVMPLCASMGIRAVEVSRERVVLAMDWAPEWCSAGGVLHGGTLMALADSAGALCASLNLPDASNGTTTVSSSTNFLGAARSGMIAATSIPLHAGSTTVAVTTEVRDERGKLLIVTNQTQLVLRPR